MKKRFSIYEFELFKKERFVCEKRKEIITEKSCALNSMKKSASRSNEFLKKMKDGYKNMAELNLKIASNGFSEDIESLGKYEKELNEVRNLSEH